MSKEELIAAAKDAMKYSHSPYSHFAVGAAILCKDGSFYQGANIENASYPCGICGERNALFHAMDHGKKKDDFVALAIVADSPRACSPCGLCRQVLSELYPAEAPIYLANLKGDIMETTIEALLPFSFGEKDL